MASSWWSEKACLIQFLLANASKKNYRLPSGWMRNIYASQQVAITPQLARSERRKERKKRGLWRSIDATDCLPRDNVLQVLLMTKFPSSCERMNSIATKGNTTVQFLPFRVLVLWCMNECGRTLASTISSHAIETQVGSMQRGNWHPTLNRCTYMCLYNSGEMQECIGACKRSRSNSIASGIN